MENEEKHLPALPSEIWLHVFSFLSVRELLQSAAVVNKLWHHLVSDEPLWKHNFASTWGSLTTDITKWRPDVQGSAHAFRARANAERNWYQFEGITSSLYFDDQERTLAPKGKALLLTKDYVYASCVIPPQQVTEASTPTQPPIIGLRVFAREEEKEATGDSEGDTGVLASATILFPEGATGELNVLDSSGDSIVCTLDGKFIVVCDRESAKVQESFDSFEGEGLSLACSKGHKRGKQFLIASSGIWGMLRVWKPENLDGSGWSCVANLRGHTAPVNGLAWMDIDNNLLASAGLDRLARVWDIERGVPIAELPLLGCGISVAQCENVVAIGMGTPINYVSLWDIRTKNTRELGPSDMFACRELRFDGRRLAYTYITPPVTVKVVDIRMESSSRHHKFRMPLPSNNTAALSLTLGDGGFEAATIARPGRVIVARWKVAIS